MHPNDGRAVSNFIVQALKGEPITIFSQTRSFCYVDDLGEAMLRRMGTPKDVTGPMNLGSPDEYTMLELAERVIELTGSRSPIVFSSLPADDPRRRKLDIRLAREHLGWQPGRAAARRAQAHGQVLRRHLGQRATAGRLIMARE